MSKSNRQYIFDALELLPESLKPFVETRLSASISGHWQGEVKSRIDGLRVSNGALEWDLPGLLKAMMSFWGDAFKAVLGPTERAYVSEILEIRNRFAHDNPFSYDDTERALDTVKRLLESISAGDAAEKVSTMRMAVLRRRIDEQRRNEERKVSPSAGIRTGTNGGLRAWRDVIRPHDDVASGKFQTAEFAADLSTVHSGRAGPEYRDPREFFSRTYLTAGLSELLVRGAERLAGKGGDPVVELQTNFGGGKTHSMLALYHMCGEVPASGLFGLDQLLTDAGVTVPEGVKRAVIVGTARSPVNPIETPEGLTIRTTWGDLAYQLGGKEGYALVAENDRTGISPGSELLSKLFTSHSPCLILIDEWVAYLRHLYKADGLPAGSFDTNLSFVQSLTEAVKVSPQTFLVASLPQSQIEVGGEGGEEALKRLRQTFTRVNATWSPATTEESYEIVRRRLFRNVEPDAFPHRDNVVRQFAKLYREDPDAFPTGCAEEDYRRKLEKAYPIHPELFEQLYHSWGSMERFQRTRGVLRLMAQLIHELWMSSDPSLMIMPGSVPAAAARVQPELLNYLPKEWAPIISGDVDGDTSTPFRIDQATPSLGQVSATRRVARAVFMASAPLEGSQNKGVDTKRVILGVCQPNERPILFEDALRRLSKQAKFLHSNMGGAWYSRSPSINRLASDRASVQEEALVVLEIDELLGGYIRSLRDKGPFGSIQVTPGGSADVPDEAEGVRLVVLGQAHPHNGKANSAAITEAKDVFLTRGKSPRVYRNTLVFLAPDLAAAAGVNEAMRKKLAWESILGDKDGLNLLQSDIALATRNLAEAERTLDARLRETWCYLILPVQDTPQDEVSWEATKVVAQDGILAQLGKKLISSEGVFVEIGARRLFSALSRFIWNGKPHLSLSDVWEYCNRFTYLPRLRDKEVLRGAVVKAVSEMIPGPFAFAEDVDEDGRYDGLLIDKGRADLVLIDSRSVIVKAELAAKQRAEDDIRSAAPTGTQPAAAMAGPSVTGQTTSGPLFTPGNPGGAAPSPGAQPAPTPTPDPLPRTFYGLVELSADRPARDMTKILEGIIEQITSVPGGTVTLRLEIDGEAPDGFDRDKQRTLLENAQVLGFKDKRLS
jgi:predicted AAA+ superfamily ATPase